MDWTIVTGTAGSVTGVAALLISWWTTVRTARAERPVEWSFESVPHGDHGAVIIRITCAGADALSFVAEGHYQQADLPPGFWIERRPLLAVGDSIDMLFPPGVIEGGWIVLSWCHPRNRNRPIRAWFAASPSGPAYDEHLRQRTGSPLLLWFRAHVLLSPVRPGGILGRYTGWRDRKIVRRELLARGVKRWRPQLPYEKPKRNA
jgi:hypothetical protein